MAKQLAHKKTKQLLTASEITEKKLNIGEFSENWQGRIFFINAKKSTIADKMDVDENGEYAIKVR